MNRHLSLVPKNDPENAALYEVLRQIEHILLPAERAERQSSTLAIALEGEGAIADLARRASEDATTTRNLIMAAHGYLRLCLEERLR